MKENFDLIEDVANFTSAGTSQLFLNTPEGVEQVEVENISHLDFDYKNTDLGRLYAESSENIIKIQKVNFQNNSFFNCYFNSDDAIDILKFDENGTRINDAPQIK